MDESDGWSMPYEEVPKRKRLLDKENT